jgi:hypothetical protein
MRENRRHFMQKEFPTAVQIDMIRYEIKMSEEPVLLDGRECGGLIEYNAARIRLSAKAIHGERVKQVLMHEIVHGLLHERQIEELIKEDRLEDFVDALSRALVGFLRDNPKMIGFYTAE